MLLEIRSSWWVVNSVLWNWGSAKLHKFYKKLSVIASLLNKTLNLHTYNCTSKGTLTGFCLNIFIWIHFFIASFHVSVRSQMFCKIDFLENSAKSTEKPLYQILTFSTDFFLRIFKNILGTPFLQKISIQKFQFNLLTNSKQINIYFKFWASLGYIKIHCPRPPGPAYFFS